MFWTPNWKKRARGQWGLAAGGILTKLNEENFDQLAFRCGKARSRHCLREWWNVDHFLDFFLKRTLEWLWTEGHSSSCIELCEAYFPSVESNEMPPYEISTELYQFMKSHLDQLRTSRLVAWDMCRLVNVARWVIRRISFVRRKRGRGFFAKPPVAGIIWFVESRWAGFFTWLPILVVFDRRNV